MADSLSEGSEWSDLMAGLRRGDEAVAAGFYARYGPLLERLAETNLASGIRRRVGSDEVAHSACRTFLRRVHAGEFELGGEGNLWHLLCAITLAKVRKKARFHLAQRRDLGREDGAAQEGPSAADRARSPDPGPAAAAEFADTFQHLLDGLEPEERQLVCLKLEQRTDEEIAETMQCSERTIRRLRKRIQAHLESLLAAPG